MQDKKSYDSYSCIAPIYDHLMAHVDYKGWAGYIVQLLEENGVQQGDILDAGCGTGAMMGYFESYGFRVSGFDLSYAMLRQAQQRGFCVWQGDLLDQPAKNHYDAVVCLYDTVHYLKEEELSPFFNEVIQVLKPDGIFIFDAITETLVRSYWANYTEQDAHEQWEYLRRSYYDAQARCQHTDFEVMVDGKDACFETHRQWIHPLETISKKLHEAGFKSIGCYEELTMDHGGEESDRVHYVVKKERV